QEDEQVIRHGSQGQEHFVNAEGLGGKPFQVKVVLEFLVRFFRRTPPPIELERPLWCNLFGQVSGQDMVAHILDQQRLALFVLALDLNTEDEPARRLPAVRGVLEFPEVFAAKVGELEVQNIDIHILVHHPVQGCTGAGLDEIVRSSIFAGLDCLDAVEPGIIAEQELVPVYLLGEQFCTLPDEFVNPLDGLFPAWQEPVVDAETLAPDNGEHRCIAELAVVSGFDPFPFGSKLLKDTRINIAGDISFISGFSSDGCLRNYPGSDPLEPGDVLFAVFLQMHGNSPFLGELAKSQRLLEQLLFPCQPGKISEAGPAQGDVEQERDQVLLFPEAVVDLLDSHLAPDGPDQTETADEGSEQLQPSYGCEGLAGCGKCKTEIICHHMGELLRNIFAKDYKPLHYLKPQVLRIGVNGRSKMNFLLFSCSCLRNLYSSTQTFSICDIFGPHISANGSRGLRLTAPASRFGFHYFLISE